MKTKRMKMRTITMKRRNDNNPPKDENRIESTETKMEKNIEEKQRRRQRREFKIVGSWTHKTHKTKQLNNSYNNLHQFAMLWFRFACIDCGTRLPHIHCVEHRIDAVERGTPPFRHSLLSRFGNSRFHIIHHIGSRPL